MDNNHSWFPPCRHFFFQIQKPWQMVTSLPFIQKSGLFRFGEAGQSVRVCGIHDKAMTRACAGWLLSRSPKSMNQCGNAFDLAALAKLLLCLRTVQKVQTFLQISLRQQADNSTPTDSQLPLWLSRDPFVFQAESVFAYSLVTEVIRDAWRFYVQEMFVDYLWQFDIDCMSDCRSCGKLGRKTALNAPDKQLIQVRELHLRHLFFQPIEVLTG